MNLFKKITSFFSKDEIPVIENLTIESVVEVKEKNTNKLILYPHQNSSIEATKTDNKGIICLPTGTGKSICQAVVISDDIIENPNQFRLYVINAPRIILTYQLLKETYKVLIGKGIDARYMFVHSGGTTNEKELEDIRIMSNIDGNVVPYSQILSGTSVADIKDMMQKAKEQNLPLIIFSTYNSAEQIEYARKDFNIPISIVISDEAQYLVQEQFHDILHVLTSERSYFFTATTIHTPSDKGRGMNNSDVYGNVLFSMTPREAIDLGFMVRPRLHIVTTEGVYTSEDYDKSLSFIIKDTFIQHSVVLEKLKPKLLISVKGTQDIIRFLKSDEYKILRDSGVVEIYAIASRDEISCNINGDVVKRQDFLRRMKIDGEDKSKSMIVLHYDTISEGIDVSGFTGIMPMRTLSKSKFLQTYGRSARLDSDDRINFRNGVIKPNELSKMIKPYSYVIIPNITHNNEDDKDNFINLVNELRSYGFDSSENIITSEIKHGIPEVLTLDGLNDVLMKLPNYGKLIEKLNSKIEAIEDAKLTEEEFLLKMINNI